MSSVIPSRTIAANGPQQRQVARGAENGLRQKVQQKQPKLTSAPYRAKVVCDAEDTAAPAKRLIRLRLLDETCGTGWGKMRLLSLDERRNCHIQGP
jgi:hypothetical protein